MDYPAESAPANATGGKSAVKSNRPSRNGQAQATAQIAEKPALPAVYGKAEAEAVILRLLPARLAQREDWASEVVGGMSRLSVSLSPGNLCSVLAVVEQESSFQADPVVPNLPQTMWREIETRRQRYKIPELVVSTGMKKRSANGQSYADRINALRTESDVSKLYEDAGAELPDMLQKYQPNNPVTTGGAMQVSIRFAYEHARARSFFKPSAQSVRHEVFTLRGGLYYGIAMLLDYPTDYPEPLYRFADYNAGRYSSRNAAFQLLISQLSGKPLQADGDLLGYQDGLPLKEASKTEAALQAMQAQLKLKPAEIRRDLLLEKTSRLANSVLWQRVFAYAARLKKTPKASYALPQISIDSPKFRRKISTAGYAQRVNERYQLCMQTQLASR